MAATVRLGDAVYRVQSLSPTLLRIEGKGAEGFEDRSTFLVPNRARFPVRPFANITHTSARSACLETTDDLVLTLSVSSSSDRTLRLHLTSAAARGRKLFAAALNGVSPRSKLPTPAQLASSSKPLVFAIRDAPRFVPPPWGATPAPAGGLHPNSSGFDLDNSAADVYLFVARHGHARLRRDVLDLTGDVPALPTYAFGLWFSWFHDYTQADKQAEVERFASERIPLDVLSLDMGWHAHTYGYVVDTNLWPNMTSFIEWVHQRRKRIYFNDHARQMHPTLSPKEVNKRYHGLTSLLKIGMDFWWADCHWKYKMQNLAVPGDRQQINGPTTWMQAIYRWVQQRWRAEQGLADAKTTLTLGCHNDDHWAAHRTPVWWTGDGHWTSFADELRTQLEYGLQLRPYVHMDCTGTHGPEDQWLYGQSRPSIESYPPEVYIRWLQMCALSSIMRFHANQPGPGRTPWAIEGLPEGSVTTLARNFVELRYRLVPMLVAAGARVTEGDGMPIMRRLDLEWPRLKEATRSDQYLLGDDLLVAPVDPFATERRLTRKTIRRDSLNRTAWNRARSVWLPPADGWIDAFSGEQLAGQQLLNLSHVPIQRMPLYVRRGGLLVLAKPGALSTAEQDADELIAEAFSPVADSVAVRTVKRLDGRTEHITFQRRGQELALHIEPPRAPWVVRVHLASDRLLQALVDDVERKPLVLPPQETRMPFPAPGSAAQGATVVEVRLQAGDGVLRMRLAPSATRRQRRLREATDQKDRIRVACIGDSNTGGFYGKPEDTYPALLGRLLGQSSFEVREFGLRGQTLCSETKEQTSVGRRHPTLAKFAPHVSVVLLGTNDATQQAYAQCGGEPGVRNSTALLVHRLMAQVAYSHLVVLLDPPPLLGEATRPTVRYHHGILYPHLLRLVRSGLALEAHELLSLAPWTAWDVSAPSPCDGTRLLHATPFADGLSSRAYADQVHLNAHGYTMLACFVHGLVTQCCGGLSNQSLPKELATPPALCRKLANESKLINESKQDETPLDDVVPPGMKQEEPGDIEGLVAGATHARGTLWPKTLSSGPESGLCNQLYALVGYVLIVRQRA